MAFDLQTFKTRTITALVFVIVMLAGLLVSHWTFFLLFSIIHFGCWFEYQRLVGLIDPDYQQATPFHKYGIMIAGWCILLWFTGPQYDLGALRLHQLGLWLGLIFLFLLPVTELLFARYIRLRNIAYSAFGIAYISLGTGLMMDIHSGVHLGATRHADLVFLPAFVIGCMWLNDTMAYLVGSLLGRTPLTPVSPKKTWEGTVGGIILSAGLMGYLGWKLNEDFQLSIPLYHWILLATACAVAGVFGDLLKSKLKRLAGVKDSGTFMPGHGGFLDRFDSLLLATPVAWLYLRLLLLP